MVRSFCRKSACWQRLPSRSLMQKSACLRFRRLTRITCWLLPKLCRQPSPRWNGQGILFTGAKRNDQGAPSHHQSTSRWPGVSCARGAASDFHRSTKIAFDSVGLTIQSVTLNKAAAKFETSADKLIISLPSAAKAGDKFEVAIRYMGKPAKGMYFILPDKDYPDRPKQIWTQGESEDTRYYLPTYDYPNDRLTTETILTVPSSWITVSNGKLISVSDAGKGLKTWYWKESVPSSTYLITVVAGEFDEVKDTWRGIPLTYYAPKGRGDRLPINYGRTPAMMELFSKKFGVDYAWEKYAQVMVDEFVAGGMENSSATTNASSSLVHPKLAPEYLTGEDDLISHELGHQWFGDLVTCKDWGDVWLNEGFATFLEAVWTEAHYGKDEADYERWNFTREWFASNNLWNKPLVRHDFDDSSEFDGNAYGKGAWILYMLRHQLSEEVFYRSIKHYLEVNRGKNVVTADLAKAIEEATHTTRKSTK